MMKRIVLILLLLIIAGSSFWLYWKQLSIEKQWLLFNKDIASHYAKELLAAQNTKTPDELIDLHIVAESNMVTFISNDQDRFFVIAYSPNSVPVPVQSTKTKRKATWIELQKDWYALNINEKQ